MTPSGGNQRLVSFTMLNMQIKKVDHTVGHFGLSFVLSPRLSWDDFFPHSQPLSGYE